MRGQIAYLGDNAKVAARRSRPLGIWTDATPAAGWSHYGSGFGNCQYRMVDDVVELRGMMTGTTATTAFTLPAGFRPPVPLIFVISTSGVNGWVQINANGTVVPTGTTSPWASFSGVRFSTTT